MIEHSFVRYHAAVSYLTFALGLTQLRSAALHGHALLPLFRAHCPVQVQLTLQVHFLFPEKERNNLGAATKYKVITASCAMAI